MHFNLISKIRLFSNRRKEPYFSFYNVTGFYPKNIDYYLLAVSHKSSPLQTPDGQTLNNERLEFLGDAILNTVVSDILYHLYKIEQEGFLTNARSNIVKRDSLNEVCQRIKLDKLIVVTKHLNLEKNKNIYGNALEALMGAIYLDYGYEKCVEFVKNKVLVSLEEMKKTAEDDDNYKSRLIEWCQKNRLEIEFVLLDETLGSDNKHTFKTQLLIEGIKLSTAIGSSKKESQQKAAFKALNRIEKKPDFLEQLITKIFEKSEEVNNEIALK